MDWKLMLLDWRFVIVVVLAFVIWAVVDFKNFKILVNQAMLVAKDKAKNLVLSSGQEQEDWVVERVYEVLPLRIKLFVSKDLLRKITYKAYHISKDLLDDGKLNDSVAEVPVVEVPIDPVVASVPTVDEVAPIDPVVVPAPVVDVVPPVEPMVAPVEPVVEAPAEQK